MDAYLVGRGCGFSPSLVDSGNSQLFSEKGFGELRGAWSYVKKFDVIPSVCSFVSDSPSGAEL